MPTLECEFEERPEIRWSRAYAKENPSLPWKLQAKKSVFVWCGEGKAHQPHLSPVQLWFLNPQQRVAAMPRASSEADKIIQRILYAAIDPDLRDGDESAPTLKVIQETVRLIRGAEKLLDAMPDAQVSTFFGEINITWRSGDRIVRLAFFENKPSVVQIGSLANPIGHYESEANPTASLLAEKLRDLA